MRKLPIPTPNKHPYEKYLWCVVPEKYYTMEELMWLTRQFSRLVGCKRRELRITATQHGQLRMEYHTEKKA